ncbi:MAG TPA: hypothetical protein PKA56_09435 [Solirubrobacterales bacterium]|nr:hypothetical protein [Solirubrobacterales bacterium]HMW46367.1 hypothetical protein [Solirubrobacterales bacterium]HMX71966.1 hypothetical protein [Solirubrobacterales bacterium]HNA45315.1 hypothetical protein [Solirubrobacterales bacterium]HNC05884.1 hypothetical protein [Solirubrobacterales bacterium]
MAQIKALLFNDPSCPWGYSASPALRTLEWRYRDQIEWHLAVIGLSDENHPVPYPPETLSDLYFDFRCRYGMPFAIETKIRPFTSATSCKAITAARLLYPGSEWRVLRTLQLLHFNTPLLLDDRTQLGEALGTVPGLDASTVMTAIDSPEVAAAYRTDYDHARSATGSPTHLQAKTASHSTGERYTAPSVIFEYGDKRAEVGGFQPVEAYDVMIANIEPGLKRMGPAEDPLEALGLYPAGLTTQEVAAIMASGMDKPERVDAERKLVHLLGERKVKRVPLGDDALWIKA